MMTLNTFGPAFGLPDASPFCLKAIALLKVSGVDWKLNPCADSRKAPMQKLPVLCDGESTVADSDAIRIYLEEVGSTDFDSTLSGEQRAIARSLIRMVEEHLYFCQVYDRWVVEENWRYVKATFFSELPQPMRALIPRLVRRSILGYLHGQGIGRFSYDQMLSRAEKDLQALEIFIGQGPYLFGEDVTAADASVGSVLAGIAVSPAETPLRARVRDSKVLSDYVAAVKTRLFAMEADASVKPLAANTVA